MTDATGSLAPSYTYDPFRNVLASGASNGNPSQFAGRENDVISLYFNRASLEPIGAEIFKPRSIGFNGRDPNLYAYVQDNPKYMDRSIRLG